MGWFLRWMRKRETLLEQWVSIMKTLPTDEHLSNCLKYWRWTHLQHDVQHLEQNRINFQRAQSVKSVLHLISSSPRRPAPSSDPACSQRNGFTTTYLMSTVSRGPNIRLKFRRLTSMVIRRVMSVNDNWTTESRKRNLIKPTWRLKRHYRAFRGKSMSSQGRSATETPSTWIHLMRKVTSKLNLLLTLPGSTRWRGHELPM